MLKRKDASLLLVLFSTLLYSISIIKSLNLFLNNEPPLPVAGEMAGPQTI
jgi:hypothetical protein